MKIIRKRILAFLLFYFFLSPHPVMAITAKAAIVIDAQSNKIYFQKNIHLRLPAASTIKVFSSVLMFEKLGFDSMVTISRRAAGIAPSKACLTQGAEYRAEDLLRAFLMSSANDAGVALAEAVSGTEFAFAGEMNKAAPGLGAKNSRFLNATGLPEKGRKQYSSVYDLALFMKKIIQKKPLLNIMETKYAQIAGNDGKAICLKNHNKFLWKERNTLVGKTGYTLAARHCFLGVFTKNKKKLIVAILGSKKPWQDLAELINQKY